MIIYIDNVLAQFPQDNLQNPKFTLRIQDEQGTPAFSFSGDLTFIGPDYDYIYAKLVTSANALNDKVILKFVDDCCTPNKIYTFGITHESLRWCENSCELTAAAVEETNDSDQITCLLNTLIYDNWNNFQGQQHPRFGYCNELRPSWLHDCVMIFAILHYLAILTMIPLLLIVASIIFVINLVANVINGIIGFINNITNVINNLPGINIPLITVSLGQIDFDGDPSTNVFQELQNTHKLLMSFIIGCGRKHPSPLVRGYAENVCGKCGIQFSSSIFNDPASQYYNACYHYAPIRKGVDVLDGTTYWIDDNKPILNGTKYFDQLANLFNAKWRVINNVLVFERRDYFTPVMPWIDVTSLDENEYEICYEWSKVNRYSYADFRYTKDGSNWVGAEANERWSEIVEWNNPYTPRQKGAFEPGFEFMTCRFRDDGIDRDVISSYEGVPLFGNLLTPYKGYIIMNSHTCYTPMILIWDTNTSVDNARVSPVDYFFNGYPDVAVNQFYNYPLWFNVNYPGNMYDNFWAINDPRTSGYQGFDYTLTLSITCERLNSMDLYGQINTSQGVGQINEIEINYASGQMIITGTI